MSQVASGPPNRYPLRVRFDEHVQQQLEQLRTGDLLRSPHTLEGPPGPEVSIGGRQMVHLCSNNYLGLANHPTLLDAGQSALQRLGCGSGASRHVSGTEGSHREAEYALADWVRLPAARLFASGYATNLGTIQALLGPGDVIFSDALNHASLIDGCRLSRAKVVVFPHRDYATLAARLRTHRPAAKAALVVSDAVFSMDGDVADVLRLRELCDAHDAGLLVDEAHSLGLFGPEGAGLCTERGVAPDVLTGMLGKACGAMGGFAAGAPEVVTLIENRARSYVFSTAPPAAQAAVAAAAVGLVRRADARRAQLVANTARLREGLARLDLSVGPWQDEPDPRVPILPVHVGEPRAAMALSQRLLDAGVFVHGIRPPSVPVGTSRLRVTAMATHTEAHVARVLSAFGRASDEFLQTSR